MDYKDYIESAYDFPKMGIEYRDIQPLLEDGFVFSSAISEMRELIGSDYLPDYWVGIESRGFLLAAACSMNFGGGIKMIRKQGKLPNTNHVLRSISYDLEYGSATIEMKPGVGNVVIVDDVYATGGTMDAANKLCELSGYNVVDKICLVDIGIKKGHDVKCLINY
jgi:adenine phosphoribosyltransferase